MAKCMKCSGKGVIFIHNGGWDLDPEVLPCPRCRGCGKEPVSDWYWENPFGLEEENADESK